VSIPALFFVSFDSVTPAALAFIAMTATVGAIAFVRVTHGVRRLDISESAPLMLLSPALVAVLAYVILGEALGGLQIAGIALLAAGAYVLEWRADGLAGIFRRLGKGEGLRYVCEGIVLYAITSIMDRVALSTLAIAPMTYLAITQIFIAIAITAYAVLRGNGAQVALSFRLPQPTCPVGDEECADSKVAYRREWLGIFGVTLFTILNRAFFVMAAAIAPIGPVMALRRTSAILSTLMGGRFNGEENLVRRVLACAIMLVGVACVVL
jgi:drug/metabolite transporter (DMT)-like permease